MAEDYKLIDNEEKHRYEFQIDGKIAEIDYIKSNNGEIFHDSRLENPFMKQAIEEIGRASCRERV